MSDTLHGSCLSFPIRPDRRGTLATTANRQQIIEESIRSIIETRQGERVMVPDYGLPDFIFEVMDAGFAARVAYFVERQIKRYEPLVDRVKVRAGAVEGDRFADAVAADAQRAAIRVEYTERGSNVPRSLVYPIWRLRSEFAER